LVLGIWWKRATNLGAVAGIAAGWIVCLGYIVMTQGGMIQPIFGVQNIAAGLYGVPVALAVTVLVSLVTPPPSQSMQDFIDSIRTPRGKVHPVDEAMEDARHSS
jgi:cation/acetate symporter